MKQAANPQVLSGDASLGTLRRMAAHCRNCPLWKNATQTVFGEGPAKARYLIVGEQPGSSEDLAGRPFVGPAGQLLGRALAEAGINRKDCWGTNAVKHFKWKPRGKIRLHQKPSAGEIDACKPWLMAELHKIAPEVLIILGATAARSLLGPGVKVTRQRGIFQVPEPAPRVILTVHPSSLLRMRGSESREEGYGHFVKDLKLATALPPG